MEITEHLFRHEAGRIVSALTRIFGIHNLDLAEDVVQDAFCRALEVWKFKGAPENPSAWLMATAKNRALDALRRERTARTFAPEVGALLKTEWTMASTVQKLLEPQEIKDDELRMMFSCCDPRLPEEAKVALILNLLCGFSVAEIAAAFLSKHSAIEKRITRAKQTLATSHNLFEIKGGSDFDERLVAVHDAIYLLFNEGYHGASPESAVRRDLCEEAMRLAKLLREHPRASTPATFALSALMCFHFARLPARLDSEGVLTALPEQDRSSWDQELIEEGKVLLNVSATGSAITVYHLEAAIAAVHTSALNWEETPWEKIIFLYDSLLLMRPSPVIALNRAVAVAQVEGPERGLEEIRAIPDQDRLSCYMFYPAALGSLELQCGRLEQARAHFEEALGLARNPTERGFLERKIAACSLD